MKDANGHASKQLTGGRTSKKDYWKLNEKDREFLRALNISPE